MAFDPESDVGRAYLSYVENRARVWAEKHLDGREPDYRGDEVLRRYHFCNVWRELDRYSRWEIGQMRGRPLREQLDIIVIGRFCMVPKTTALLLGGATLGALRAHVVARRTAGLPWYSNALSISTRAGEDYCDLFARHRDAYINEKSNLLRAVRAAIGAQELIRAFSDMLPYVGVFRAYELATSLTYSEHLPRLLESQLFHVGRGAVDALEMLTGSRAADRAAFSTLRDRVVSALPRRFRWIPPAWQGAPHAADCRKFTLRTLEDSLCEFRKYVAFSGGGLKARLRTYRVMDVAA